MVKKVAKRRKGYQQGGSVTLDDAFARSSQDSEATKRYTAASDAIVSSKYNQMTPEQQARFRAGYQTDTGKLASGRDKELARADYPGFARGGKVRKVAKTAAKRKR